MRKSLILLASLALQPSMAWAQDLDISAYQTPDGAITAMYQSNIVDPYFASRALLVAKDEGFNVDEQANAWIAWAIKKQEPNGLFNRYRRNGLGGWDSYRISDADDASLALWLELLYRVKSPADMNDDWKASIEKTKTQLALLLDPEQGIYHVSVALPVGLLMDNAEIYAALRNIAVAQRDAGNMKEAQEYDDNANALGRHILQVFGKDGEFAVSTQMKNGDAFYPDKVAQLFPVIYHVQDGAQAQDVYRHWMWNNGNEWLAQRTDDFAWGLVAVLALDMKDIYSASCWRQRAEPMRYSRHWNVLEEVALQDVKWHLQTVHDTKVPCVGGSLS
jgi:hypothetical protein